MAGDVNLFLNDPDNRCTAEIEIMIAEKGYQGKGLGKQALAAMLIYGAQTIDIKTYTAKIGYDNTKSLHLFEKYGFKEVSRADCFREVTLELGVTDEVLGWLSEQCSDLKITVKPEEP